MPKFDVKLSYTYDDWQSKRVVKRTETQRHSGRTVDEAVEAAIENLVEEHGSSAWDIKVVGIRKVTAPAKKGGKK